MPGTEKIKSMPMAWLWGGSAPVNVADPAAADFSVPHICRALARIPRYSGQTESFLSVAHHLMLCDWLTPRVACSWPAWNAGPDMMDHEFTRRGILLHDFPEAYVQDLPSPLKSMDALEGYREIEKGILLRMHQRWLVPVRPQERRALFRLADLQRLVDRAAVNVEVCTAMPHASFSHFRVSPADLPEGARERLREIMRDPAPVRTLEALADSLGVR